MARGRTVWMLAVAVLLRAAHAEGGASGGDPQVGTLDGSPLDDLPPHVELLVDFGQRPDWSPDGKRLVFLDGAPLGDVWQVDVRSRRTRKLTGHFGHRGFSRAHHLANGDLLLCGPTSGRTADAAHPEQGRFNGVLSVLRAPYLRHRPQPLGMPCWEGVATSKRSMRIAWNRSAIDYTAADIGAEVLFGVSEIWTGTIRFNDAGRAYLVNAQMVVAREAVFPLAVLEVQDFRPNSDELILTAYAYKGGEVMGVDSRTGEVRDYSQSRLYEEAESVFPDGRSVLVERDLDNALRPGPLDIWRLSLDGRAEWQRLTFFNRYRGFYASNPAVRPGGRSIAFQLSLDAEVEGQGSGVLLFDLERFEAATR